MEILRTPGEMSSWAVRKREQGRRLALVPTMGCFHEGHLCLMRFAARKADDVVVSLFVNPTQFGPEEDLAAYPRDFDRDRELSAQENVSVLFCPDSATLYPEDFQTTVSVEKLTRHLCGIDRPGHFAGVTTVVNKLLNIVGPHWAIFGEKDFQQCTVIRRMVEDLNMNVEILTHPIVREQDGLAMSSRNTYLAADERPAALSLYHGLQLARKMAGQGVRAVCDLQQAVCDSIRQHDEARIDYVRFVDSRTLTEVEEVDGGTILALAVRIGGRVRLIDNGWILAGASHFEDEHSSLRNSGHA